MERLSGRCAFGEADLEPDRSEAGAATRGRASGRWFCRRRRTGRTLSPAARLEDLTCTWIPAVRVPAG